MEESENSTQKNPSDFKNESENTENEISQNQKNGKSISWTAGDAISHNRSGKWYFAVILIAVALIALLVVLSLFQIINLLMVISTGVLVLLMTIALFLNNKSSDRENSYQLDKNGLKINTKQYSFSEFRAFGVRKFGATWQLVLIPAKRFGMFLTAFIHEDQGEEIVDFLGARLPMEEVKFDLVDKIANKLKI